jgi:hypothetical protein
MATDRLPPYSPPVVIAFNWWSWYGAVFAVAIGIITFGTAFTQLAGGWRFISRHVVSPYKERQEAARLEITIFNNSVDALLTELRERQRMISVEVYQRSFHSIDLSSPAYTIHEWVVYRLSERARQLVNGAHQKIQNLWAMRTERESVASDQSSRDEAWLALSNEEVAEREAALRAIGLAIAALSASKKDHKTRLRSFRRRARSRQGK